MTIQVNIPHAIHEITTLTATCKIRIAQNHFLKEGYYRIMDQYNYQPQQYPQGSYPNYDQVPPYGYPNPTAQPYNPELQATVDAAFRKCLASMIMSFFPFVSVVAIFFAVKGLKLVAKANDIANYYGMDAGSKNISAKVFGTIGKISGIVTSAQSVLIIFYIIFYFIYFFALLSGNF